MKASLQRLVSNRIDDDQSRKSTNGLSHPAIGVLQHKTEPGVNPLRPLVYQGKGWEKVDAFTSAEQAGQSLNNVLQPQWERQDNGIYVFTDLDSTGGIIWYYHEGTDRMTFDVPSGNPHANQLKNLKNQSMTHEQWMELWATKDWSREEVAPPKKKQAEMGPFTPGETINFSSNPDLCQNMVRLWIKYKADLRFFYNHETGGVSWVADAPGSVFHQEARALPPVPEAHNAVEFLEKLSQVYGSDALTHGMIDYTEINKKGRNKLLEYIEPMQSGSMIHISLRKSRDVGSGGHAVGAAKLDDTYYIFDPNLGNFAVGGTDRFIEVIDNLTKGEWSKFKFFYDIEVPNVLGGLH